MSKNILNNRAIRISLACTPCRNRHMKCDGLTPTCSRCQAEGVDCVWIKSRRGGRPRKTQLPVTQAISEESNSETSLSPSWLAVSSTGSSCVPQNVDGASPQSESLSASSAHIQSSLINFYYQYFHSAQPCVLPRCYLEEKITDRYPGTELLLPVIKFIGSLYTAKVPSDPFEEEVKRAFHDNRTACNLFEIQAVTIYAIAVWWRDGPAAGRSTFDHAIDKAIVQMKMHRRESALALSREDEILAESHRRTWWLLYMTDAHMSQIIHAPTFRCSQKHNEITTDLPCEEHEYESGCIPTPRTLADFDHREFEFEGSPGYSSFALLIGLMRSFDHYIAGERKPEHMYSRSRCTSTDAAVSAWSSLLPKSKRSLILPDGKVDEMLWKAESCIQVYIAEVHRPFSTLAYSPVETVSTCAPPPPPERIDPVEYWDAPRHTAKILQAMEQLTDLLTLTHPLHHSPFSICIIAAATITHLSACKYVLEGEKRDAGRERIRAAIGVLETFSEVWRKGKKITWEVKTIARDILGLGQSASVSAVRSPDARPTVVDTISNADPVDWSAFAGQMAEFDSTNFAGFEDFFEASLGSSGGTFSSNGSSDVPAG